MVVVWGSSMSSWDVLLPKQLENKSSQHAHMQNTYNAIWKKKYQSDLQEESYIERDIKSIIRKMNQDEWRQKKLNELKKKMFAQGLAQKAFEENNQFQNCLTCSGYISAGSKPALLSCGHIICGQCLSGKQLCTLCDKPYLVKQASFQAFLNYIQTKSGTLNENILYDFKIHLLNSGKSKTLTGQPGCLTVEQILTQDSDFVNYLNKTGQKTQIRICNKSFLYQQIKSNTLLYLQKQKKIKLVSQGTEANNVTFSDRYLGGKQ